MLASLAVQLCSPSPAQEGGGSPPAPLVITFAEIPSSVLPTADSICAKLAGIHLALIDDTHGRDMPLVKGNLTEISIAVERGVGNTLKWIQRVMPLVCKTEVWRLVRESKLGLDDVKSRLARQGVLKVGVDVKVR